MGDKFKISEIRSEGLRSLAQNVNEFGGDGNDGINENELAQLQRLLNGDKYQHLKNDLANESDSIKTVFGYTGSVSATKTTSEQTSITSVSDSDNNTVTYNESLGQTKEQQVKNAYYKYRGIDPVTRKPLLNSSGEPVAGLSPKEAYEAVEKDLKDKKEYKDAVKDLKKYSIDTEAKLIVLEAIEKSTSTDPKQVKKDAEKYLKNHKPCLWDKHTKKALDGNGHSWIQNRLGWLSGQDSDMKLLRKAQAAGNNAEEVAASLKTKKDFTDAIGKRSPLFKEVEKGVMAIEKLTGRGKTKDIKLVTKTGDDTYDVSKLVEFIGSQIGADNTMNRQQNDADSELEKIRTEFRRQGVNLTKRDTKQLVEFCGYRVERKNFIPGLYRGSVGALAGAAGTAVTAAGRFKKHGGTLNIKVRSEFESVVKSSVADLEAQGKIIESIVDDGTFINIRIKNPDASIPLLRTLCAGNIPLALLKSAATAAGVEMLASLLEYGPSEKAIFNTNIEPCQSFEEFMSYVNSRKELTDAQKSALIQIAFAYIKEDENGDPVYVSRKDGEDNPVLDDNGEQIEELAWDQEAFIHYLEKSGGYGSDFNKIELYKAVKDAGEIVANCDACDCDEETPVVDPVDPVDPVVTVDPVDPVVPGNPPCEDCETKTIKENPIDVTPREVPWRSWPDTVNGYDCLQAYNRSINNVNLAGRMVKVIQAIDISKVSTEEELKQLYNIKTIAAFAEDTIRFGINQAIARHPELPVIKSEYLDVLDAPLGLQGQNVYVPDLYDPDTKEFCGWNKKTNVTINPEDLNDGSGRIATHTRKIRTFDGKIIYQKKCPGSDEWVSITKEEYDALQKK